jgi:hypothetical protein
VKSAAGPQKIQFGHGDVDTEVLLPREHQTGVDNQALGPVAVHHEVEPELSKTA